MPIAVPILIVAGITALTALTVARRRGASRPRSPETSDKEQPRENPPLTLKEFLQKHLSPAPWQASPMERAPGREKKKHRVLRILNGVFFPLCLLAFGLSFWQDPYGLLRILSIAGMIGFGTNWIAITMLFHPRRRRILLGQGLIPRQRDELVESMAEGVFQNLINEEIIRRQLEKSGLVQKITADFQNQLHDLFEKPEFREDLRRLLQTYLRDLSRNPEHRDKLVRVAKTILDRLELGGIIGQLILWTKPVWKDSALQEMDRWIEKELPLVLEKNLDLLDAELRMLPGIIGKETEDIEHWLTQAVIYFVRRLDIKRTIREQLGTFDEARVERMIKEASDHQLQFITILGGILGLLGGLILWNPAAIVWLAAAGVLLFGLDASLTWLFQAKEG